jgi:predicted transcriptional regulator
LYYDAETMAISIRLPESVKKRVEKLAAAQDRTAHAFMLEAIREKVEAEEARARFHAEAKRRLARMKRAGAGIPADDVFDHLSRRARDEAPARPKARRVP